MRSERRKQMTTLSILLVAILVISVGFAAFSATLKINSKMTVNPDNTYFKVKFSSNANTLETNAIKASPENKGSDATIDNTSVPTISGISANFTVPGDTATYTFYVRNEGRYEAFLNSITLKDKNCIEAEGTNSELAQHICDSITMSLSVGNITTSETMLDITGESLSPGESKQVTVTISYDENAEISDGPFTVEFGDISMYYATVSGLNEEIKKVCLLTNDVNGNKAVDLGDEVTCDTEMFLVIPNDSSAHPTATSDNITLLTKYNLYVGYIINGGKTSDQTEITNSKGIQSSNAIGYATTGYPYYGTIAFSTENYWGSLTEVTFIYNNQSLLYSHVENYKTYMKSLGVDVKEASLASKAQTDEFKNYANFNPTSFWLGSASGTNPIRYRSDGGSYNAFVYSNKTHNGVRPIIVIPLSDVGV